MDEKLMRIVNRQFEMIGLKVKFSEIPESGVVTYKEGKKEKKDYWYNIYKFTEEQEAEWSKWALEQLMKNYDEKKAQNEFVKLSLLYGLSIKYKKEGTLF